ncbi:MAG: S41 family peptidase [Alphaproteobacteria bacterium]|nr:S41 family peptidase [Rhodospirillales bacterium]MCW9045559.1 S41 family peptidase [Alphaproteobacteria bacterium]
MKNRPYRPIIVIFLGILLGAVLSPSLSGCSSQYPVVKRAIGTIIGADYGLPESTVKEIERFHEVYVGYLGEDADEEQLEFFSEAIRYIRANHVHTNSDVDMITAAIDGVEKLKEKEPVATGDEVIEAALDALTTSLDPHSAYLNPEESRTLYANTKGEFGGLGISVTMKKEGVNVIAPIADTPAARAGVQAGDLITHLDGESVADWPLMKAVTHMRGTPGTPIVITVLRGKEAPFDLKIVRAIVQVEAMRWRTEGDIGYIRVIKFTEKVEPEIEKAVDGIKDKLGNRLKGIVLDLRNNPGGLLSQSVILSDAFIDDGTIVSIRGRNKSRERVYGASNGDLANGLPVIVLINEGSASASEIVSAALKESGRALVMGRRSFGKGSVQTLVPMRNDGILKLTTQLYYSPKGQAIQANGVEPDILLTVEKKEEDEKTPHRREIDYPNALKKISKNMDVPQLSIKAKICKPVMNKDLAGKENEDFELGCAMQWINSGSTNRFVELVNGG